MTDRNCRATDVYLLTNLNKKDERARFSENFLESCLRGCTSRVGDIDPEHEKDFAVWLYLAARAALSESDPKIEQWYDRYQKIMGSARKTL